VVSAIGTFAHARKSGEAHRCEAGRRRARLRCVHPPAPTVLILELDVGAEPVSGTVRCGAGSPRRFAGVLELLRLVDDARAAAASAPDDAPD
jgi:hypothetical protein